MPYPIAVLLAGIVTVVVLLLRGDLLNAIYVLAALAVLLWPFTLMALVMLGEYERNRQRSQRKEEDEEVIL